MIAQYSPAPCVPRKVHHTCADCTRQRLPHLDGRGGIKRQVIDASVLRWPGECPMRIVGPK